MVSCPIKHRITVKSRRTGTNCRILGYVLASRCQRVLAWNVTSRMVGTLRFQPIFALSCDSVAKTILWDLGWNGDVWILNVNDIHTWSYRDNTCNHYIYMRLFVYVCLQASCQSLMDICDMTLPFGDVHIKFWWLEWLRHAFDGPIGGPLRIVFLDLWICCAPCVL